MEEVDQVKNNWVLARAIALYYANIGPARWMAAFEAKLQADEPGRSPWHPSYASEAMEKYSIGFAWHFGTLDFKRQQLQLEVILERYGDEATQDWLIATDFSRC